MPSPEVIDGVWRVVTLVVVLTAVVRALTSLLRTWIEQASRTRRLKRALKNTKPNQRAEIIEACSRFEGEASGKVDGSAG